MSLERVRMQLKGFGLAKPGDEKAVSVQVLSSWYLFSDATGDGMLIARVDDVSQKLNEISYRMGRLTPEQFWSGSWLESAPRYRSLDALWRGLPSDPHTVNVLAPKTAEKVCIGRAKRLCRDFWLFESEDGEYGLVPERETRKWFFE